MRSADVEAKSARRHRRACRNADAAAAAHGDDVRKGHFEQTFVAPRGAEAARLHTTKGHARIGGRDDEIVDKATVRRAS